MEEKKNEVVEAKKPKFDRKKWVEKRLKAINEWPDGAKKTAAAARILKK